MSAVTFALAPTVSLRSSNCTKPSTLPSMCRSSLPVISPLTCRLPPSRAVPLLVVEGYVESKGAMVLASPEKDDALTFGAELGCCCGSGCLAGVSPPFLSPPHIYPPSGPHYYNNRVSHSLISWTGAFNLAPSYFVSKC